MFFHSLCGNRPNDNSTKPTPMALCFEASLGHTFFLRQKAPALPQDDFRTEFATASTHSNAERLGQQPLVVSRGTPKERLDNCRKPQGRRRDNLIIVLTRDSFHVKSHLFVCCRELMQILNLNASRAFSHRQVHVLELFCLCLLP